MSTDNPFAGALRLDQEFQKLALGFPHSRFEVRVVTEGGNPSIGLPFAESKKAVRDFLGRVFGVTRINAYRAAMSGELFDVKDREAMRGENTFHRVQREIREVLVVHLVELISVNRSKQVRKLDGDDSGRCQQDL